MTTRRYPRTLEEAFGPYTSRDFGEQKRYGRRIGRMLAAVCIVLYVAFVVYGLHEISKGAVQ